MQNHVIRIEQALRTFGGVPLTHGTLLSILGESRSPNNKTARMIDEGSVGTTHANCCRVEIEEKGRKTENCNSFYYFFIDFYKKSATYMRRENFGNSCK